MLNFFLDISSKKIRYRKDLVEYQEILARAIIIVDDLNNEILDMNKEEIDENENDDWEHTHDEQDLVREDYEENHDNNEGDV